MPDACSASSRAYRVPVPPAVGLGSRFGKYRPEEERSVRKVEVKEDAVLRQLKDAWRKFEYDMMEGEGKNYEELVKQLKGFCYSSRDVENFSLVTAEFQDENRFLPEAGLFLSALINNGRDSDFVIHTQHLKRPIHFLGYRNTKNITVNGDVGGHVGNEMKGGTIIVNGDAGVWVGDEMKGGAIIVNGYAGGGVGAAMEGGAITVNGDAGVWVGDEMKGGSIIVNGYAGSEVGGRMKGGEIHLEGDYKSLSGHFKGGGSNIYHKGVLIVEEGKRIK